MTPSVGRIVHYHNMNRDEASIITRVYTDGTVDLTSFPPGNLPSYHDRISEGPGRGQWTWPPRVE